MVDESLNTSEEKLSVSILSEILVAGFPVAVQMGVTVANSMGNAILFSHISPKAEHSAAAAIVFTVQSALSVTLCGFFYRLPAIINDHQQKYSTPQVIVSALVLAGLVGIPIGLITSFSIKPIFLALHTDKAVCDIIGEYYLFFPIGLLAYLMSSSCYQASLVVLNKNEKNNQNTGFFFSFIEMLKYNVNIKVSMINLLLNFGLDYILLELISIKTISPVKIISINFSTANMARLFLYLFSFRELDFFSAKVFHECVSDIFNNGIGACVQMFSELGVYMLLPFLSVWLLENTTENLRILNVITQYMMLSQAVAIVLGQTAMRLIKEKCFEKRYNDVMQYIQPILTFGIAWNLLGMTLALSMPSVLIRIFHGPIENHNTGLSHDLRTMLAIQFFLGTMDVCRNIIPFVWRIFKIYNLTTQLSVSCGVLGIALSILLAKPVGLGIAGIVLGPAISQFLFGIISLLAWKKLNDVYGVKKLYEAKSNESIDSMWKLPALFFSDNFKSDEEEPLMVGIAPGT